MVGILLFKETDTELLGLKTPEDTRQFFQKEFPGLAHLIPDADIDSFAGKSVSRLPFFQYTGPELHYTDKVVLLGDAIHIVKPYFGLGVNAAFEDVGILESKLDAFQVRSSTHVFKLNRMSEMCFEMYLVLIVSLCKSR